MVKNPPSILMFIAVAEIMVQNTNQNKFSIVQKAAKRLYPLIQQEINYSTHNSVVKNHYVELGVSLQKIMQLKTSLKVNSAIHGSPRVKNPSQNELTLLKKSYLLECQRNLKSLRKIKEIQDKEKDTLGLPALSKNLKGKILITQDLSRSQVLRTINATPSPISFPVKKVIATLQLMQKESKKGRYQKVREDAIFIADLTTATLNKIPKDYNYKSAKAALVACEMGMNRIIYNLTPEMPNAYQEYWSACEGAIESLQKARKRRDLSDVANDGLYHGKGVVGYICKRLSLPRIKRKVS